MIRDALTTFYEIVWYWHGPGIAGNKIGKHTHERCAKLERTRPATTEISNANLGPIHRRRVLRGTMQMANQKSNEK